MAKSKDRFEDAPPYYMQYLAVRDGGGAKIAHHVAEVHGITIEQLKANCRRAAEEYRLHNGALMSYDQAVLDWAES
ncbi:MULTISPECIES: hypothetical protein [Pseudomonas]|uniref:hypothetical protein n=1 Tax=Pseudomonas TaxID=286 RepID=UPI0011600ACF|nr:MULTISPECIES: hypothetical protein [Pseudomonas]NMY91795.1 hypothetical protein [Pseudomonas psychrotolerans]NMY91992.1 hypothetical protein [Pseudomonas psychrotolerans]NRH44639.1 hypothetical protein [Pseudomonas sp. MS15a(2019)]HJE67106.1 hypothetical protein [Pseudomonas oryzihabitans]